MAKYKLELVFLICVGASLVETALIERDAFNDYELWDSADIPCQQQYFNSTSFVCVCDSSYCDTFTISLPNPGQALRVVSSKDADRYAKSVLNFTEYSARQTGKNFTISINSNSQLKQKVVGFGGALSDAAAIMIASLPSEAQENLLMSYFSSEGNEYNIVRTNMAGCDFSAREYTYCDTPDDFELDTFKLAPEDTEYKIPQLIAIKEKYAARESLRFFASPWTAPSWMKTNNASTGHGRLIGKAGDKYHKTWANYFVKFLEAYNNAGVNFWAVTMQNEPINGLVNNAKWQQTAWNPVAQRDWLASDLSPALLNSNFPDTKIIILDDQRFQLPWWPKIVMNTTNQQLPNVKGIGIHWYGDNFTPKRVLDMTHRALPDMWMLGTEACNKLRGDSAVAALGSWEHGENYSNDILADLNHWVGGWTDWNMVLNMQGKPNWAGNSDDSPIIVDGDKFYKNPMFYHLGHFSKFVDRGWRFRTGSDSDKNFKYAVFDNPPEENTRKRSVVLLNRYDEDVGVVIRDSAAGNIECTVVARSIQSFIYYAF